ncbi:hypothetical protein B7463_g3974, partial [Scytalidium lignicola]
MDVDGEHAEPGALLIKLAHAAVGHKRAVWVGGNQDRTVGLSDLGYYAGDVGDIDLSVIGGQEHLGGCVGAEGRVDEALELDGVFFRCKTEVEAASGHSGEDKKAARYCCILF